MPPPHAAQHEPEVPLGVDFATFFIFIQLSDPPRNEKFDSRDLEPAEEAVPKPRLGVDRVKSHRF